MLYSVIRNTCVYSVSVIVVPHGVIYKTVQFF